MSDYLTPAEVAGRLKISPATVYRKIDSGEWECTKISDRLYRFTEEQFAAIGTETNRPNRRSNKTRLREALKKIA